MYLIFELIFNSTPSHSATFLRPSEIERMSVSPNRAHIQLYFLAQVLFSSCRVSTPTPNPESSLWDINASIKINWSSTSKALLNRALRCFTFDRRLSCQPSHASVGVDLTYSPMHECYIYGKSSYFFYSTLPCSP